MNAGKEGDATRLVVTLFEFGSLLLLLFVTSTSR